MIKQTLITFLLALVPSRRYLWLRNLFLIYTKAIDPELEALHKYLNGRRTFIDIGANKGTYSYYLSNTFRQVKSFEPLTGLVSHLKNCKKDHIEVFDFALGDVEGHFTLYTPLIGGKPLYTRSSIVKPKEECTEHHIAVAKLDSFNFNAVDCIKIDVEGHELAVLKGALKTIKECRPVLLIEVEQRHHEEPISGVFDFIMNLNYSGHLLKDGKLLSLDDFDVERDQLRWLPDVKNASYVNNFFFFPMM